ncbi:hypothetical protein EV586_106169 [Tumebacillus sp. BK434]|uniref:hypothetical protein n=1 Tax=Tumebacillus sp. BK434 TaxID=2512169 RepID=UPI001052B462|nr:hypothetical protein [Tumebacillus sp. BK434]TCP53420.1 hypothetical protein EV586_106169 [Tumebacillus sp. BK434]
MFLQHKELNADTVAAVTGDIEQRLTALLARWNDTGYRAALLQPALEEATFYMPFHREAGPLVVLAIRYSPLLQDLHGAHGLLDDTDIRAITTQAVEFFSGVDLAAAAGELSTPDADPFHHLPAQYPLAWAAFDQLARSTRLPKTYEAVTAAGSELPPLEQFADGSLLEDLQGIERGEISFLFRDSFKMISRDLDQLFAVLEFVLRANKTVITHNFYLSNGMVSRRNPLLKPASKPGDIAKKFDNKKGLVSRHKDSLRLIKKFIVPPARAEEVLPHTE